MCRIGLSIPATASPSSEQIETFYLRDIPVLAFSIVRRRETALDMVPVPVDVDVSNTQGVVILKNLVQAHLKQKGSCSTRNIACDGCVLRVPLTLSHIAEYCSCAFPCTSQTGLCDRGTGWYKGTTHRGCDCEGKWIAAPPTGWTSAEGHVSKFAFSLLSDRCLPAKIIEIDVSGGEFRVTSTSSTPPSTLAAAMQAFQDVADVTAFDTSTSYGEFLVCIHTSQCERHRVQSAHADLLSCIPPLDMPFAAHNGQRERLHGEGAQPAQRYVRLDKPQGHCTPTRVGSITASPQADGTVQLWASKVSNILLNPKPKLTGCITDWAQKGGGFPGNELREIVVLAGAVGGTKAAYSWPVENAVNTRSAPPAQLLSHDSGAGAYFHAYFNQGFGALKTPYSY